jgi:predicted ferric reductase
MRLWLAARGTGVTTYLLLTALVILGLVLSHPVNQSTWKLSKRLFPWHENLFLFTVAFLVVHVVSLVLDPYAGVGVEGALIPGLSSYRSVPVAIGVLALYALLITGLTARYTRLIPKAGWLKIHRVSIVTFLLAWVHGITTGTDYELLRPLYVLTGLAVIAAAAYRYWVGRQHRATFAARRALAGELPASVPPASVEDPSGYQEATS